MIFSFFFWEFSKDFKGLFDLSEDFLMSLWELLMHFFWLSQDLRGNCVGLACDFLRTFSGLSQATRIFWELYLKFLTTFFVDSHNSSGVFYFNFLLSQDCVRTKWLTNWLIDWLDDWLNRTWYLLNMVQTVKSSKGLSGKFALGRSQGLSDFPKGRSPEGSSD